jgi:hypothetical protein
MSILIKLKKCIQQVSKPEKLIIYLETLYLYIRIVLPISQVSWLK